MTNIPDFVLDEVRALGAPKELCDWLARRKLMIELPFHYLVPDEAMLPPESIKFFHVDNEWLDALLDGALSIGRTYSKTQGKGRGTGHGQGVALDNLVEWTSYDGLFDHTNGALSDHRRLQLYETPTERQADPNDPVISGFLLRSTAMQAWKGVDIAAYAAGHAPYEAERSEIAAEDIQSLEILRLEHLSSGVLLGLFVGEVFELTLHQPPEAVHFGFSDVNLAAGSAEKSLRVPNHDWDNPQGFQPLDHHKVTLHDCFANKDQRVLSPARLAAAMKDALAAPAVNKPLGYTQANEGSVDRLLSSDFAMQMVQGVGMVRFLNHPGARAPTSDTAGAR